METQTEYKTAKPTEDNSSKGCLQTLVLSQRPLIRAYRGDCMDWMQATADKAYDLAIVDPPYGIERFKKGSLRFDKDNKYENGIKWDIKPTLEYFTELRRVSKYQIIWGANNFELQPSEYFIIWNKKQTVDNFASAEYAWTNYPMPAKIFEYSIHKHNQIDKIHPTQKPVALYRWLLKNYAKAGQRILDTHGGSFSSAVACFVEGFDLDICEIDAEYFEAGVKRFKQATKQMGLFDDRAV